MTRVALALLICLPLCSEELKTGPQLPHKIVADWAKLPRGWNLGETSGVDVDKNDNVWVFNRGPHGVIQFDKNGKFLQAWNEVPVKSSHGIRVGPDGNIWAIDVKGHTVLKFDTLGRVLGVIGLAGQKNGNNDSKDGFNEPTSINWAANGDFYVSDGYQNSRVVKFGPDMVYKMHWGTKGTSDGEFNLVHDVAVDNRGRVYVGDRNNNRVQVFDENGKFITKWTGLGSPWGLYYVARENAIYMCDGVNSRILKLNLEGQILGVLSSYGKVPGKLDFPHHLAVDSEGSIYVAEIKNWRVSKFALK